MKFTNEKYPFIQLIEEGRFDKIEPEGGDNSFFDLYSKAIISEGILDDVRFENIEYQDIPVSFFEVAGEEYKNLFPHFQELNPCFGCYLNHVGYGYYYWILNKNQVNPDMVAGIVSLLIFKKDKIIGFSQMDMLNDGSLKGGSIMHKRLEFDSLAFSLNILAVNLLIQFSPIEISIFGGGNNPKKIKIDNIKYLSDLPVPVKHYNSLWYKEIHRTAKFTVHGFWRNQPYGPGNLLRKSKWIDSFEKYGYNRDAGKNIKNDT